MNRLAILAACATLQGCASYHLEYEHVSHLSAGWPTGPSDEEDTLDHVQVCGSRSLGMAQYTGCVGYSLREGGFNGPRDTAVLRVQVPLRGNLK